MKVAHIVASLEARHGGPSKSVRRLAMAATEIGDEVELLTSAPQAAPIQSIKRLNVRTWRRGWPDALSPVRGMSKFLQTTPFDVVHHHGLWLRTLHYAHRKTAADRIPLVISPRGMMSPWAWQHRRTRKAFAARWVHPKAMTTAAGWHATSSEEHDEIRRIGYSQPICVAPNGVDTPSESDLAHALSHWRQRAPRRETKRVALFFSRFHRKKRVVELIEAWAKLKARDWTLLIVGVPEEYSVQQLREFVLHAGVADYIDVHDGAQAPPPYAVASLFLLPSLTENFGLVIAEAMAHGVPVVVTDTTPWREVQERGFGWCVPWSEYGRALEDATRETPEALQARGAAARDWVLQEFSWEKSARTLAAFYAELCQNQR